MKELIIENIEKFKGVRFRGVNDTYHYVIEDIIQDIDYIEGYIMSFSPIHNENLKKYDTVFTLSIDEFIQNLNREEKTYSIFKEDLNPILREYKLKRILEDEL